MKRNVTIIVTVYNIAAYLDRFFNCLKQQSYTDYAVLIIDDGSSDDSLSICRRYAAEDDRITVIHVEHIGISAARNLAIERIETEYVTSLDGDDYFEKDYLSHLMLAQKKYDADLVLSNVVYHREDGTEIGRFEHRDEAVYSKEQFRELFPALLREERLNYLYAKLYRTEYLKNVRVEPDVKQGSDTMINCCYIMMIYSIAVIEDYDYNYVKYTRRSVTSYKGKGRFERLYRINKYVYDCMEENGYLSDEMIRVIDIRILACGKSELKIIGKSNIPLRVKYRQAQNLLNSEEYSRSYRRMCDKGMINTAPFVVAPEDAKAYIDHISDGTKCEKKEQRREKAKKICPEFLLRLYRKIKKD